MMCAFSDVMNFTSWKHASPTFANFDFDPEKYNRYTFYRAILENTALVTLGHMEIVKESTGCLPDVVVFGGGASKSPLWTQILCDTLGVEVRVPVVKEATALGAAIMAGYGIGIFDDLQGAASRLVKTDRVFKPDPRNHELYLEIYSNWRKFYKAELSLADQGITRHMWAAPGLA
jgi:autoinducer 2 (AI-2) kinase